MLGVSVETIRRHCDSKTLTCVTTIGGHRRILRSSAAEFATPDPETAA